MDNIYILSIETATPVCSVALHCNGLLVALRTNNEEKSHATLLLQFCDEVLHEGGVSYNQLSAVAVSSGPGSYTGLRIGASTAKGFCYALAVPLIAIPTLDAMVVSGAKKYPSHNICAMIDARRLEVYARMISASKTLLIDTRPIVLDEFTWDHSWLMNTAFIGNGAFKVKELVQGDSFLVDSTILPDASAIGELAYQKFLVNEFEDVAYFEPFYLKEFQTTTSKKNILC